MNDAEYRQLYDFRARLQTFLRASEGRVRAAGLTPMQYLLLLGIRASDSSRGPTVGDMAEFLILKHHSVVELVDRAAAAGLLRRAPDPDDGRVVRLRLTAPGRDRLERVAAGNYRELGQLRLLNEGLDLATRGRGRR